MCKHKNVTMLPVKKWTMPIKTCKSCNSTIKTEICPHCGARQGHPVSKRTLLLATFFCGRIGLHKSSLGKYWQVLFYFLFLSTGIPILIALIEFIIYAFTSSDKLNKKYSAVGHLRGLFCLPHYRYLLLQ